MKAVFPKNERLCGQDAIQSLFESGKRQQLPSFQFRKQKKLEASDSAPRILIVAPKRYLKKAVDRNRVKRLIREAYRQEKNNFPKRELYQSIAILYASSQLPEQENVKQSVRTFLQGL